MPARPAFDVARSYPLGPGAGLPAPALGLAVAVAVAGDLLGA